MSGKRSLFAEAAATAVVCSSSRKSATCRLACSLELLHVCMCRRVAIGGLVLVCWQCTKYAQRQG